MFSIENLAWKGNQQNLLPVEQGPGDTTIKDTRGRIMWFPPYNIQFSESTSVNWESTNFIGRGEPVYTYNNTEPFNELRDMPSYTSRCIDHTKNNKVSDFTMMYYVNPYSDSYGDSNIIEDPEPYILLPEILSSNTVFIPTIEMPAGWIDPDTIEKPPMFAMS